MGTFLPILSFVIGAAQGVAQYAQQNAQAKAQREYQQQQIDAQRRANEINTQNALKEAAMKTDAEAIQANQETAAAEREQTQARIETLQARGEALASAGAGNFNLDLLLNDYERAYGQRVDDIRLGLENSKVARNLNKQTALESARQRISSQSGYIGAPVEGASGWGLGLGILGNGLSAWQQASRGTINNPYG